MAISPQEASALTPDVFPLVDALEKKIDAYLLYRCAQIGGWGLMSMLLVLAHPTKFSKN